MIFIPKYTEIYNDKPILIPYRMKGEFKCILRDLMGRPVYESPWDSNLILTQGLDYSGTNIISWYFHIGSSNTAPDISQTQLLGHLFTDGISVIASGNNEGTPNYGSWQIFKQRFNAGDGTGTVREIGSGIADTNTNLFCRHVLGVPIVKGVDNILDVFYKKTNYPPLGTVTTPAGVTLDGVDYTTKIRGSDIDVALLFNGAMNPFGGGSIGEYWDGDIGDNLNGPTGNKASTGVETNTHATYIPGSYYNETTWPLGLSSGNLVAGIRSMSGVWPQGKFQCQFNSDIDNATIPKDDTKIMSLTYRVTWAVA